MTLSRITLLAYESLWEYKREEGESEGATLVTRARGSLFPSLMTHEDGRDFSRELLGDVISI